MDTAPFCHAVSPDCMGSVISQGNADEELSSRNKASKKSKNETNFPAKLHYMLGELEKDGLNHIVEWRSHGRAFMVVDQAAFANEVLPLWFRQSKYSSFQRQLNLYGFKRITSGKDKGCHYHEHFLRGMPDMANKIERTKVKGTGTRKSRSSESQPNFYSTPFPDQVQSIEGVPQRELFGTRRDVSFASCDSESNGGSDRSTTGSPLAQPPSCDNLLGLAHTATLTLELMNDATHSTDKNISMRHPGLLYRPSTSMAQLSRVIRNPSRLTQSTTEQNLLLALIAGGRL